MVEENYRVEADELGQAPDNANLKKVGRLQPVKVRGIWPSEARDFTPWLEENLDQLAEALGLIGLQPLQREHKVGPFSIDLLAATPSGDKVVIENQLEQTDHDHLGKVLTYMSHVGASKAIWVTTDPRPEHVTAVQWFNDVSSPGIGVYLVQIQTYRIENSPPAPLFHVVAKPLEERKETERDVRAIGLYREFWQGFLIAAKKYTQRFATCTPRSENALWVSSGLPGFNYGVGVRRDTAWVGLGVYFGPGRAEDGKKAFEALEQRKGEIEQQLPDLALEWNRDAGQATSRITHWLPLDAGIEDRDRWQELWEMMAARIADLARVMQPILEEIWAKKAP